MSRERCCEIPFRKKKLSRTVILNISSALFRSVHTPLFSYEIIKYLKGVSALFVPGFLVLKFSKMDKSHCNETDS